MQTKHILFIAIIVLVYLAMGNISLPFVGVLGACAWIIYDYHKTVSRPIVEPAQSIDDDLLDIEPEPDLNPHRRPDTSFDIDLYNGVSIPQLHRQMGCSADNQIANRMKYMAVQSKASQVARAAYNVNTARPFFEAELRENEARDWWDNENDYLDQYM